jgi:hypothetical protein
VSAVGQGEIAGFLVATLGVELSDIDSSVAKQGLREGLSAIDRVSWKGGIP